MSLDISSNNNEHTDGLLSPKQKELKVVGQQDSMGSVEMIRIDAN
jgi:hypothetical protein